MTEDRVHNLVTDLRKKQKVQPAPQIAAASEHYFRGRKPRAPTPWQTRMIETLELLAYIDNGDISAQAALGLGEKDARGFVRFGAFLLEQGKIEDALACAEVATGLAPKEFSAWLLRGCACARLKQDAQALLCYGQAAQLDPKSVRVWTDLAELHLRVLDYKNAVSCLHKAIALDPKADTDAGKRAFMLVATAYYSDQE